MLDADMGVIMVLEVQGNRATVQLPDTSVEEWRVASLPGEVLPGDRVGVTVDGGDLAVVLLPRLAGLRASCAPPLHVS